MVGLGISRAGGSHGQGSMAGALAEQLCGLCCDMGSVGLGARHHRKISDAAVRCRQLVPVLRSLFRFLLFFFVNNTSRSSSPAADPAATIRNVAARLLAALRS